MSPDEFKNAISTEQFRRELHHLLWIEPSTKNELDMGWSCREHALFVGVLALLQGFPVVLVHGHAAFIQGSIGDIPPGGITQDPHTWLRIDGVGTCDLSVRLNTMPGQVAWKDWRESYLLASVFVPSKSTAFMGVSDPLKFEALFAEATHQKGERAAVYLNKTAEHLGIEHIENARRWCNSPLTDRLKKWYPTRSDIYAKAILHLNEILCSRGQSIIDLPQIAAWGAIGKRPGNGRLELVARLQALS